MAQDKKALKTQVDYDCIAESWSKARTELPLKDKELFDRFIKSMPGSANVLDLGCGTGYPIAKKLCDQEFSVVGVDCSKKLLEIATKNTPDATLIYGDIGIFHTEKRFNGVVLWDVVFHIPRKNHENILRNIYTFLHPGGLLIVSSGGSENPPFTDTMFGVEFFYDAHAPENLLSLCKEIGFRLVSHAVLNEPSGNRDKGRIGLILSKP